MSYCHEEGKGTLVFLTPEDALKKEKEVLFENSDGTEDQRPSGMAIDPCGVEFRKAFSCFHYSEVEVKGSDCIEKFNGMQDCMKEYPDLYDERNGGSGGSSMPSGENEDSSPPPKEGEKGRRIDNGAP
ncbi:mitochondrial intermembrane space import and assembly protein 40-A-like [Lepeophtheirus salmonis]|uniref:mitochondrial intermembrane space import and assembly protein 40-A-like n=1 Tax=Lepeophtheirus salmonis TaxID=72036 RepID=UPI003AF39F84